jgi:hypothetical protein
MTGLLMGATVGAATSVVRRPTDAAERGKLPFFLTFPNDLSPTPFQTEATA